MPLYEYVCQKCERKTEVIQRVGERPIRICPQCGGKVKKAFSAPAIQFKGSGFYITDYPKGKTGEAGSSSGKTESGKAESGKSESGKSEPGKSEAKSDSGKSESTEKASDKKKETKETKGKRSAKD